MLLQMYKAKISNARITATELFYEGSITIDQKLMKATDILPGERVQVVNLDNGNRFETYVIIGKAGSGEICLNGPAAHKGKIGQSVHIIAYGFMEPKEAKTFKPKVIKVNEHNRIKN
jgi:aspartate 1-decarboxylase